MAGDEEKAPISSTNASGHHQFTAATEPDNGSQAALRSDQNEPPESKLERLENVDEHIVIDADKAKDPYSHLLPAEQAILKGQVDVLTGSSGWKTLYRYGTTYDFIIIAVSIFCAIAAGAALPLMMVIFGNLAGQFNHYSQGTLDRATFNHNLNHMVLYFIYLGIGEFVTIYVSTVGFIYTGEHITGKIRAHYLEGCMRQNVGFFDNLGSGEITTRITADTNVVQDGISEKIGLTLNAVSTLITAFIVGFIKSWKLTLILSSILFSIAAVLAGGSRFILKYSKQSLKLYALGGSVAEEVISSIRNAIAFGTQDRLARQYDKHLGEAKMYGYKVKFALAFMIGCSVMIMNLNYSLAFWAGSKFLVKNEITLAAILTILISISIGAFQLGTIAPNAQAFTAAISAAAKIFDTIDRSSPLDATSKDGLKLSHVEGSLELKNIKHIYPSRPDVIVMNGVDLFIPAGKQTALVGASGSGKSTIVGLIERFYSPVSGRVLLDGQDISTLNLGWLRQQMSLVGQEPTLFGTTILENIGHGLIGTKWEDEPKEKKRELIVNAAKMANAHDFVSMLPEGYQTNVGERGFLLSGGQKQRIAIARAIVRDPKILLLDEATSALDTKSEEIVQAALEVAAAGRTTITIAHRLSTVKNADNIVVMAEGRITEQGTHDELLLKRGVYYSLVEAQKISNASELQPDLKDLGDEEDLEIVTEGNDNSLDGYEQSSEDKNITKQLRRRASQNSHSSRALSNEFASEGHQASLWSLVKLIASFNKPEWMYMSLGLFWAIMSGGGSLVQSIFFAKEIIALASPLNESVTKQPIPGAAQRMRHNVDFWALMYLMLAFVQLFAFCIQGVAFAFCSERLIHRVRDRAFRTILRQDVVFFDREENTTGALTSFLGTQTTHVAGLSGVTLGTILTVATTLIVAIICSISIAWKLALVCASTIPVLLGCGFFRYWLLAQFQQRSKKAYQKSASYACEATGAIRTVASLTRENDVLKNYRSSLDSQAQASLYSILKSSLLYAASQSLMFLCIALGFWYGGQRIADREYTLFQFFVTYSWIIFGAQSAGSIFSFAPDMGKAIQAAQELKDLFDRSPLIDTWSTSGASLKAIEGTIEFRNVCFHYPTRPEQRVLCGLNLSIKPGQYVALVGASGCGKSTTIALLERFYDPLAGGIFVDGKDIASLNINEYRSFIALVSQEPTLYQGTIRENILLGLGTVQDDPSDSRIEFACREANIYDFIMSLPDGFDTIVGSKGSMLSGGQKQRIAIARALIRNPKILLLDEATSALDSESEQVVQAALDKAAKGRTTIAVAHRLSTIQKADIIYVIDQGTFVESGNHNELMSLGGRYSELVNLQSLEKRH